MGCLYLLTGPSGKQYVGITSLTMERRWRAHRYNAAKGRQSEQGTECVALYGAIRKYGHAAFTVELLAELDSWEELCRLEVATIAARRTKSPHGYNLTDGGEGSPGAIPSAIARERMSEVQQRLRADPEYAAKQKEYLARAVAARAARWHSKTPAEQAAWIVGHRARLLAAHQRPEVKAKMLARVVTDAGRAAMSAGQRGCKKPAWTEERKRRASEQRKAEWLDPVMRQKRIDAFALARKEQT